MHHHHPQDINTPPLETSNAHHQPPSTKPIFGVRLNLPFGRTFLDHSSSCWESKKAPDFSSITSISSSGTPTTMVNIIRMAGQFLFFQQYQQRVSALIGAERTQQLVNEALVLITLGGNDFVNNYFLVPYSARSQQFSLPDYVRYLISEYQKILMRVYELGGRRVLVTGTGPLGCAPAELAQRSRNGECAVELQRASSLFNPQLAQMIKELNSKIGSNVFISANTGKMHFDFISDPQAYGFVTAKIACCGQGPYNGLGLCTPASNLCPDRDLYAFWDAFHPSEKANRLIVQQIMTGSTEYMNPMNLSTIMAMDSME